VRLASPIGSAAGGSVNLSDLSNVAKLAAHPISVWVFNANCDGTIIYNDPVLYTGYFTSDSEPTELKMQPTIHLQSERGYLFLDLKNLKHS
jgi:hypothetical protein